MKGIEPRAQLRLRPLVPADLPRVMQIEQVCFTVPWQRNTFASLFARSDTDMVAAEREGELVGYAICWTTIDEAELGNVAVHPDARRTGVADALVRAVLARAEERGARACFLEVRESNESAQALYRRHGFEVIGRRARYYSRPAEDALIMRRRLPISG